MKSADARAFLKSLSLQKMTSYARRAVDRLIDVVGQEKKDELRRFLSTEEGFRPEQVRRTRSFAARELDRS